MNAAVSAQPWTHNDDAERDTLEDRMEAYASRLLALVAACEQVQSLFHEVTFARRQLDERLREVGGTLSRVAPTEGTERALGQLESLRRACLSAQVAADDVAAGQALALPTVRSQAERALEMAVALRRAALGARR